MTGFQITFSDEFKSRIYERALELHTQGLSEGLLEDATYGALTVCIDNKPKRVLFSATGVDGPLKGHEVYCGSNEG